VNQGGSLESLSRRFLRHLESGQLAQFVVNYGKQLVSGG
jgi:hypothetical protein